MEFPKPQALQSLNPRDYDVVVCVAGTRYFNDRKYFHEKIIEFLSTQTKPVLFISGAAPSGADDLIIRWCEKFCYPCKQMPADWNNDGKAPGFVKAAQGFIRNAKMAKLITYLIGFWDKKSNGTKDMIERCEELNIPMLIITIPTPERSNRNRNEYQQHHHA